MPYYSETDRELDRACHRINHDHAGDNASHHELFNRILDEFGLKQLQNLERAAFGTHACYQVTVPVKPTTNDEDSLTLIL